MPHKPGIDLNDTGNRIIAGIALALVFIGGWWLIARSATNGVSDDAKQETDDQMKGSTTERASLSDVLGPLSEDTPTIAGSRESVTVEDQAASMSVQVKEAALAELGWIAVRDADGRTLGAGRFDAGTHTNIEVPLLRGTVAGERYQVLIYVDDGDKAFDIHKDILVTRGDGSVAGDTFSAR